jgi:hypothetical protein
MIFLGETSNAAREVAFHLPSSADPTVPVTGHAFIAGEVKIRLPGGAYANADPAQVVEKGFGDYALVLTDAQVATKGKVYIDVQVAGAQAWSSYEEITSKTDLAAAIGAVIPAGQRTITLLGLRTATLQRGGIENSFDLGPSSSNGTAVLNAFANEAIAELYDILVEKDDDRFVTSTVLATAINVDSVALPGGFYELRKLEIVDGTSQSGYRRLRPCAVDSKHLFSTARLYGKMYRYWLNAYQVTLVPTPQAVESLRLYYVPVAPTLVNDADILDGWNGYEELVIQLMWRRCLIRRDLDTGQTDREIERLIERVKTASDGRDDEPFYLDPRGPGFDDWGNEWP